MLRSDRCEVCRFYVPPGPIMGAQLRGVEVVGGCHVNPPTCVPILVPAQIHGGRPTQGLAPGWPPVGPQDWCGQFVAGLPPVQA